MYEVANKDLDRDFGEETSLKNSWSKAVPKQNDNEQNSLIHDRNMDSANKALHNGSKIDSEGAD
jgi:hypothetical protein